MERRMKVTLLRACIVTLLALAFLVCSNPIDIVSKISDEVKASHNMFLLVSNTSPSANSTVSPGSSVVITFDRSIDFSTATSSTITFSPAVTWDSSIYDNPSRTLTIIPAALDGGKTYTITITKGVKGTDGSSVQSECIVAFTTKKEPYGTFKIVSPSTTPSHDPAFTKTTSVTVVVTPNQLVYKMHIYQDGGTDMGWMTTALTSVPFTLSSGDGQKTIWMEFTDDGGTFTSTPISQNVTLDTAVPAANSITINGGTTLTNSLSVNLTYSGSDTNGLYQMQFYNGASYSGWVAYADSYSYSIPSGDGTKTVYVQFGDKAGNISGWKSSTITLDQTPPPAPTITGTPSQGTGVPSVTATSGGGDGVGVFRYSVDSTSSWSAETGATYTPSALVGYDYHSFYAEERDAAGNWSSPTVTPWSYLYYPSFLRPVPGATGVSINPTLVVAAKTFPRGTTWEFYGSLTPFEKYKIPLMDKLTALSYQITADLPSLTLYYWQYKTRDLEGTVTYVSPVYSFKTGSLR